MQAPLVPETLGRYFVELTPSECGFDDIQALAARARAASERLTRSGTRVRLLRSVFVPDDGACFLLYEAESEGAVGKATAKANLGAVPVVQTLHVTREDEL